MDKKELEQALQRYGIKVVNDKVDKLSIAPIRQSMLNNAPPKYDYHSIQVEMKNCSSEKDFGFSHQQMKVPEDVVYREYPQKEGISGFLMDDPRETFGLENNPHITVLFGLKNEADYFPIHRYFRKFGNVTFEIGNISRFSNPEMPYDVIKFDIKSPQLHALNHYIRANFDVHVGFPEYKPHMTIAYVKKGACQGLEGPCDWTGTKYTVSVAKFSHNGGWYMPMDFIEKT